MKKVLLTGLVMLSTFAYSQVTVTFPTKTFTGASVDQLFTDGDLQGTLTSVGVNATLSASLLETYADDLLILVTATSSLTTPPAYVLQVGGFSNFQATERGSWANGGSDAIGTVVNDTYTLITPLNFTTNPTMNVWLGNGYSNSTQTNSGTWTNITVTLTGVSETALGTTEISEKSDLGITVYPNPAIDEINVRSKAAKIKQISIVDISGRSIKTVLSNQDNDMSINVSDLESGSYILIINTDKGRYNSKFIKK